MSTPPPADPPAAPSPEIDSAALDWFVRRGGGGIDAAEETAFQAWLAADGRHRAAFAHWQRDWAALDALPAEGLDSLRKRLSADKAAARAAPLRRAWWRGLADWAPQGALAAVLLTVVGGSYLAWSHWQQPLFVQSFATARGQQLDVALPDGSRLRLDTATRADVTFYRQRRELRLPEGQTVLQVKGDAARPFDVLAGPLRITVVGTRFSVRYTPGLSDKEGVHVAVEEGRVRVARADRAASGAGAAVELGAGQQVASDAAGRLGAVSAVPAAGIAPWRESRVSFDNTPLARALAEFERYGPTHLVVRDPGVAALRVTGTFDPHRLDNFSRVLPQVLPVRLRAQDDVTEIVSGK
ncbi:FecR domain-containing protein [Variovorax sp. J22G21]|uniref:FecR family protein n=1 Tax=Variovorax fucosicus TaxID=3053517 RepID=UPI0025773FB4|nr:MULTISPECIES: FecR domain-containing protein [unclassified Variovorax]MDM0037578.1 FecR domain-containing protein [Variovorax sp. J22R193]MDM0062354.1 FecR domain-containing protein [Variovorax sp. J22G21]